MLTLTLDYNCLINLENSTGQHAAIRELVSLHRAGVVSVHVGVISASENVRDGEPSYAAFAELIERLRLNDPPRILPEARIGMSYIGHSVIAHDDGLNQRVRDIIHPLLDAVENGTDERHRSKQRNVLCDVDALVGRIRHGHDVFVTEDRHFLRRRERLLALNAKNIMTPVDALEMVRGVVGARP